MLPRIILHNAVSLDGRMDWLSPDLGLFYALASRWQDDATLVGSSTILQGLAQEPHSAGDETSPEHASEGDADERPLMVIPDSRGRLHSWHRIRKWPYWRDVIVLCSRATRQEYLEDLARSRVEYIVAGDDHVDLRAALEELCERHAVKVVRVDSGGTLNGALLRAGLVDEVSVMISPCLIGGTTAAHSIFRAPDLTSAEGVIDLKLAHMEKVGEDTVWLRYEVRREP